jgi:signal transduction histidine kinase
MDRSKAPREGLLTGHSGNIVFIIVVVAAYFSMFSLNARLYSLAEIVALVVAGTVYAFVGTYGFAFCERTRARAAIAAYFIIQLPISAFVGYMSRGAGWLLALPLVAHSVVILPRRGVLLVCALVAASFGVSVGLQSGWANVAQALMQYLAGIAFVAVFMQIAVSEQKARAEVERLVGELSEANRRLREYAAQAEELATAKERNRMAREIHDSLGHYLTVINVQIEAARAVIESDQTRARDAMDKAQSLTKEGLADVRRSVAALRVAPVENRPLSEALASLVEESRAAGIHTTLEVIGAPRPLSPQVELALYRAAQEGLTNVRKHARASHAGLTLNYGDGAAIQLTLQDDGVGSGEANSGFGLLGVRERVQLLGGQVSVRTAAQQGFTLQVELPG